MRNWKELDGEFLALAADLQFSRLDLQWGAAGVYVRLAGSSSPTASERFETLASIGGRQLRRHPAFVDQPEIVGAPNDFAAWAFALKVFGRSFRSGFVGEQRTEGGESAGFIYTGAVDRPAEASANICLELDGAIQDIAGDALQRMAKNSGASQHLRKASRFLREDPPDPANAAKEAISAVEALARFRCQSDSATLGDCLKQLKRRKRIHAALADCLEKLWGFTNQSPGVRHGSQDVPEISIEEARFVLSTCQAAVQLLLAAT
jgi:hypothetical protein